MSRAPYISFMVQPAFMSDPAHRQRPSRETDEARAARLAREAEMIDQALASAAAGRVVSEEAVDVWIDILGTDHELPRPRSGH
jgi:predicted transcriptional regulator